MKVGELKSALELVSDDEMEIIIRCTWEAEEPAGNAFALRGIYQDLDHDTAEPFLALECDQDFEE